MEAFYLYIPLIFLAISTISNYIFHKLHNLPPTPWLHPQLPLIGHLYLLRKPLHRSLAKLSAKHGPIQLLQFGSRRVLVVSSPSLAEECLTTNDITFANRPCLLAGKYLGYNYTSLVFAPYGDHWRNLRRVSALEILSCHRLREFEPIRADEMVRMPRRQGRICRAQIPRCTEVVQVKPFLVDLTLNAMMRMISGKRYYYGRDDVITEEEKKKADRFQEMVVEISEVMGATNVGDYLPVLRWFGVSKLEKRLICLQAKRDLFMKELVEELKEGLNKSLNEEKKKRNNMIEMLLSLQKTEPECYTDEMIRSIMLVMLAGGTGTSISTMEWAMSLLLNNPNVLKKSQAEIDKYVGADRLIQESDMTNLPYLGCIIKETIRMFPPGPLLPHESAKDCKVGGYHIPSGTMLLVNVWGIQNDPTIWDNPETFRPERFEGLEGYRDGFKYMPFGFGRRSCPGEGMATRMVAMGLGSLIQCFEWERTSESKVDLSEGVGITIPKAISLEAICRPRSTMLNLLPHL
ncbi:hypothetical protein OSB04_005056 [Centaurea solstitialis]|uniref:Cytochrome P450 n=1 Tax=Centaurea solstitialis TaxID=347529 RepID=A0AA38WRV8_9ASTR|nr:hypothetical protein OSB04_005056 [Centaurea solstitialis]